MEDVQSHTQGKAGKQAQNAQRLAPAEYSGRPQPQEPHGDEYQGNNGTDVTEKLHVYASTESKTLRVFCP
jgi:hypothetical protein